MVFFQQGDVLLKRVEIDFMDSEIQALKDGRWVIAEGEHTGHAHVIDEKDCIVRIKNGKRYVISENGFTITHEEHKSITVEPGIYEVGIVQEYDHFAEEARNIAD